MPEPLAAEPFLLVTPGGGGDGQGLLRRYLDAVADGATGGLRSVVVTGPLLSAGRRAELMTRAERLPSVEMVQFSDRLRSLIASAIGVVSMAGYNTVVEELAAGTPALLAPRCAPRLEQHLRATRLAPRTTLEHLPLEAVDPARVRGFVERCRAEAAGDRTTPSGVALDGVANAVRALVAVDPTEPRRPTGRLARAR
jgi:predicted glycosyltransferase